MRVFHRTPYGQSILENGFRDGEGLIVNSYGPPQLCDVPPRKQLKRWRKERRRMFEAASLPRPEPWNEQETLFMRELFLDATTFAVEPLVNTPPAKLEQITDKDKYVVSPNGEFAYQNRILHVGTPLEMHRHGYVIFSDDVAIPMLIDLNRDAKGNPFDETVSEANRVYFGNVWMSLTPNEMMSQRSGIAAGKGTAVIGGLGLGWFVRKVCEKECVERVIVVDVSQELLDWYGYDLCASFPKVADVICDDIYNQISRHGEDAVYLLDIWPTHEGANSDRRFQRLKLELGDRLWGWGWCDGG